MEPLALTAFWMICILWIFKNNPMLAQETSNDCKINVLLDAANIATYYWYWDISPKRVNNVPKVVLDLNPDNRHNTSSTESIEYSDNEDIRRKNMQKLKYQTKTRWPSRTSMKARYNNKSL